MAEDRVDLTIKTLMDELYAYRASMIADFIADCRRAAGLPEDSTAWSLYDAIEIMIFAVGPKVIAATRIGIDVSSDDRSVKLVRRDLSAEQVALLQGTVDAARASDSEDDLEPSDC